MGTSRNIDLLNLQEESQADVGTVEGIAETIEEAAEKDNSPPKATVARRAKSYSDFYDIVTAHLKKEKELERKKSKENIGN
jgi:conserved oligomeric Golgi complex subunit 3